MKSFTDYLEMLQSEIDFMKYYFVDNFKKIKLAKPNQFKTTEEVEKFADKHELSKKNFYIYKLKNEFYSLNWNPKNNKWIHQQNAPEFLQDPSVEGIYLLSSDVNKLYKNKKNKS